MRFPYPIPVLLLSAWAACGFSDTVNGGIRSYERQLETEACKQALEQTNLMVGGVMAHAGVTQPVVHCDQIAVGDTQCRYCYTDAQEQQTLSLSAPCTLRPPQQSKDVSVSLTLSDLKLQATHPTPELTTVSGGGDLSVAADLPLIGMYGGTASYELRRGAIGTLDGSLDLALHIAYVSGDTTVDLDVSAARTAGASEVHGSVTGAGLLCDVTGTLKGPQITCR